jgi:outer membrane protein
MKNKMSLFLVLMLATGISQAAGDLKIGFVNVAKVLEKRLKPLKPKPVLKPNFHHATKH